MAKNRTGTFIALGVFAALLAGVLLTRDTAVNQGVQHLSLPSVQKADIVAIELSGPKTALLKKVGDNWTVADPAHPEKTFGADLAQVEPLLTGLTALKAPDFVTSRVAQHTEYEVDATKGQRVKVSTSAGVALDVIFGKAGTRGGFYVRLPDSNDVFWSPSQVGWALRRNSSELRVRAVTQVVSNDLREVTLEPAGKPPYTLARADVTAPWALTSGAPSAPGFRFDLAAASQTVQAVTELRAQEFLESGKLSEAALGFDGSHPVVKAKTADGKVVELHVGKGADSEVQRLAGVLRDVAKTKLLNRAELESVAGQKENSAHDAAALLLKDAARFQWLDTGGWAAHPADGTLSPDDLDAVARGGSLTPVRVAGNPEVALVGSWSVEALVRPVEALRDLSLFTFDAAQVRGVTLSTGGKTTVALAFADGAWKVTTPTTWPDKEPFDPARVMARLGEMRRWRAQRVAESTTPAQAGLTGTATAQVVLVMADKSTQTLKFGKPLPGKPVTEHYAQGAADNQMYVVPETLRATLAQGPALFDKQPPPPAVGAGQGLESLPPEIRQKIEAMQARGGH